jgi:hypothetical protein
MSPVERPGLDREALEHVANWGDLDPAPLADLERRQVTRAADTARVPISVPRLGVKAVLAALALWALLLALAFMKDGARGLAPAVAVAVATPLNALGLGWLGALLVLSGSPVAASALALYAGGSMSADMAFAMVVGSRLGAAFVVLLIGTIYALRRRDASRRAPISIGVLALAMTAVAYVPGGAIGYAVLRSDLLAGATFAPPGFVIDLTDRVTTPIVTAVANVIVPTHPLGGAALFGIGVVLLHGSFRIVDVFLPALGTEKGDERARWYVGPWTMFGIGLLTAAVTLSVSVALTLLVPVVAKGYVRREQILPYIAGANITTLVDTLLVAFLLADVVAPRIVLSLGLGVTVWTVVALAVAYVPIRRLVFAVADITLRTRSRLVAFVSVLFAVPVTFLLLR